MNLMYPVLSGLIFFGVTMWGLSFLAGGFFPGITGKFVGILNSIAYLAMLTAAVYRLFPFLSNLMFTLLRKYFHPKINLNNPDQD